MSRLRKDGTLFDALLTVSPVRGENGEVVAVEGILKDITDIKRAEEALQASLGEKTLLLNELNHRVKNNMQIISSMLSMSSRRTDSPEALDVIRDCTARIQAMSLMHSELYSSGSFEQIDLSDMSRKLSNNLTQAYWVEGLQVRTRVVSEEVSVPFVQAVPCALAINEMVTNALKHAFVGRAEGEVDIHISENAGGLIRVEVRDDGVGMPAGVDLMNPESLGLGLVRDLVVDQLQGTLGVNESRGTALSFEFPRKVEDYDA